MPFAGALLDAVSLLPVHVNAPTSQTGNPVSIPAHSTFVSTGGGKEPLPPSGQERPVRLSTAKPAENVPGAGQSAPSSTAQTFPGFAGLGENGGRQTAMDAVVSGGGRLTGQRALSSTARQVGSASRMSHGRLPMVRSVRFVPGPKSITHRVPSGLLASASASRLGPHRQQRSGLKDSSGQGASVIGHTQTAPSLPTSPPSADPTTRWVDLHSPNAPVQVSQVIAELADKGQNGQLVVHVRPADMGPITVSVQEIAGQFHVHVAVVQTQTMQWFASNQTGLVQNLTHAGHPIAQMTLSMDSGFSGSGSGSDRAMRETERMSPVQGAQRVAESGQALGASHALTLREGRWYV